MLLFSFTKVLYDLCLHGDRLANVKFTYNGKPLVLKSIKSGSQQTTIELQDELEVPEHSSFLGLVE